MEETGYHSDYKHLSSFPMGNGKKIFIFVVKTKQWGILPEIL